MATGAEALTQLANRRNELAANLNTMGVAASSTETLKALNAKVLAIPTDGTGVTPEDVYAITRPADWLTMPDVSEDEMYMLFHLKAPAENYIAFTVTCTGSYTVEYGIVSESTFTATGSDAVSSGTKYQNTFLYDDWADETSGGSRQVMLRITGTDIKTFIPTFHSDRNWTLFYSWNVMEVKANLPVCTRCLMGATTSYQYSAFQHLRYFSLEGTNSITNGDHMFRNCRSLLAVLALDTSNMTTANYLFYYAMSLAAIPKTCDFSNVASATYMLYYNCAIVDLSWCNFSSLETASYMFQACNALRYPPIFDSGKLTSISGIFNSAISVEYIVLYCATVTAAATPFGSNYNLSKVILSSTGTTFPAAFTFQYSVLTDAAAEALADSLPEITTSRAITVSGTPFAASANYSTIEAKFNAKGWALA